MDNSLFNRTELLLGKEAMQRISSKRVIIFGVGGVGSWCAECLVREGIAHLTLVDSDVVCVTNCNRQLMATTKTIGEPKVEALKKRLLEINPEAEIVALQKNYSEETSSDFNIDTYDYVIDAIDSTDGKLAIWKYCQENGIPFIACLGAARRLDPEQLIVTTLNKTEKDPLARKLRYLARQKEMDLKLKVVCSKEDPLPMHESGVLGSMIFVPATAGLICRKECIKELLDIGK